MNFSEVEAFMQSLPGHGIPVSELRVAKNGREVFRTSAGFADAAGTRAITPRDTYYLFSCTKIVTCSAALHLLEEGKISLSDPVSRYIPAFAHVKVKDPETGELRAPATEMTLEHLFTMTGGLTYDLNAAPLREAMAAEHADTFSIVSAMAETPLVFDPGTRYRYSLCHDVLAAVVERVTGTRFAEYVQRLIFDPLGMTDISFHPTKEQKDRLSEMYVFDSSIGVATPCEKANNYDLGPNYDSGGAGLCGSADSYAPLIHLLGNGGISADGYRLLKPETVAMISANRLCPAALKDFVTPRFYGYGWGLCGRTHMNKAYSLSASSEREFGWDGAAASYALADPGCGVSLFFATHIRSCAYAYYALHPRVRDLVYRALDL